MQRSTGAPLLLAIALGVVLGLLGMHTFSADPVGHGPGLVTHAVEADDAAHDSPLSATAHGEPGSPAQGLSSAAQPEPSHSGMAMTCVLALLAGLLLAIRPSLARRVLRRIRSGAVRSRASASRTAPRRPPSHITLCISRT
ncbi:DUF6153 family protein [Microbacterium arabinogalactanolyticum]|uniref:Uncharacterized protein n=1 Tax=Microbacterium arabinogalactanolyticum TaxID=69365 RepID=A0ABQ5NFD8_9MICO|nr:DUF6153 family protein [Microbacterium arabinogalactanolyticum]GLC84237.1 hypothetical protein MIAR_08250 [Microbacterium arabinogalactanolyticum]